MCEQIAVPEANLISADGLSLDACATVEFLSIGAHAVRRGNIGAGEQVLVVGAGPIGIGVALFARLAGAEVTLLDLNMGRLSEASALVGASQTINVGEGVRERVAEITGDEGFDAVFDATGNRQSMEANLLHVAHGGRYVLVSVINSEFSFSDPEFHKREMSLIGSRNATNADFRHVMDHIAAGNVPVESLITHRTDLSSAVLNIPKWASDKSNLIKAMIEFN